MEKQESARIGDSNPTNQNLIYTSNSLIERSKELMEESARINNLIRDLDQRTRQATHKVNLYQK